MAATASPQLPMSSSPEFGPDMGRRRSSIVHMGAYRVIRRNSQMLSESGPLLSPSNASVPPTSPLLQIASDISNSLLSVRRNSLPRRYSTELSDTQVSDKNIKSESPTPSRGTTPEMTRLKADSLGHSKSFSFSSTGSDSAGRSRLSGQETAAGRLAGTGSSPKSAHAIPQFSNITETRPQSFLTPNLRAKRAKRGSHSEASATNPDEDLKIKSELTHETGRHGNARRGSLLSPQSPRPPTASQLNRKRLSVEFTALREQGRQLLTESIPSSHPAEPKTNPNDRVPGAHVSSKDSGTSDGEANLGDLSDNSATPEPKAKSKFLSSLYTGHEKIQNFINKGRSQIKAQELNARLNINRPTGSFLDGAEVKSDLIMADEKGDNKREGDNSSTDLAQKTRGMNPGSFKFPETVIKEVGT